MPTISQILASSFEAVVNEARKPSNQWSDSTVLSALEQQGMLKKIDMGPTIEEALDYRRNPNAGFLATDLQSVSLAKTEVLTAASYTPGRLSVPMVWSKEDEALNSNKKVDLAKSIMTNGIDSHDDLIEDALFDTSTDGFLGLQTIIADNGVGTVGGINATTDAWFRNYFATYAANGSDIESALATARNSVKKGSSGSGASLIVSGSAPHAIYESQLQANQRFIDIKMGDSGFKALAHGDAPWVFSQHGGTRIYGLSKKAFKLYVSKAAFRTKGEVIEIPQANGYICKLFTLLQACTGNRSRLFVLTQA
jgi:hypothetical protein